MKPLHPTSRLARSVPPWALASTFALMLAACGGGGGSSTTSTPVAAKGTFTAGFTDAPSADYQNVWVTISEIDFHADLDASPSDPAWLKYPLPAPVTINLAALNHGNFQDVFQDIELPVGVYQQVRLMLVDDEAALTASASAAGLAYNDQVDYLDAGNSLQHAPLELVGPRRGIGVFGTFTVAANANLHLIFDFDLDDDVVRFPDELAGSAAFTLKPHSLRYFDMAEVGAITGTVDPGKLAAQDASGAYDLVIKAEVPDSTGAYHVVARATTVDPVTGAFTLFPLPMGGQQTRNFDVLIRGRNMDTTIVKSVPVATGTSPTNHPTVIANGAIPVNLDAEYTVNLASAANPTGTWVDFYQTLPASGEIPYEVRFRHVNPFTGLIDVGFPLSSGNIYAGTYVANGMPTFTGMVPAQGAGGFGAVADAIQYVPSAPIGVTPGASSITLPQLSINSAVAAAAGTITLNVTTATPGRYDRAQLVIARYGEIVDTVAVDPTILAGSGGAVSVSNLPAGTSASPDKAAFYYGYLRVWKTTSAGTRAHVVPILDFADFRTQNAATLSVTLP
ncbi:MAG TPA: DUF4382 domain-containing protein [Burkholderiaceae bacterium]|nr:DUF4382 domain-containing protein [Burkholderiaceae bacterium]